jgi:type IV secretion system protein VirB9
VTALAALAPTALESAAIFQKHTPVPLENRAFDDAAQVWANSGDAPVLVGTNGAVMYAYGESHPTITCAPLRICLIHLMPHEHITNMSIGDSVRWLVQSAEAGAGNEATPVVITKPVDANLITNLAITTDAGRVYYLTLHSDDRRYVPEVGFYDPQQIIIRLKTERAAAEAKAATQSASVVDDLGVVDPAQLDFRFTCKAEEKGAERLLPLRVFAGAGHTYLQMPADMAYGDAPAVFSLASAGPHAETQLINSHLTKGYYVVDGLPTRLKLIVGVSHGARSVLCTHD